MMTRPTSLCHVCADRQCGKGSLAAIVLNEGFLDSTFYVNVTWRLVPLSEAVNEEGADRTARTRRQGGVLDCLH